jgi:hypothetical protein
MALPDSMNQFGDVAVSTEASFKMTEFGAVKYTYGPKFTTDGITTASLDITLPKNAVVRQFDVVVGAKRADATLVANVGQVRTQDSILGVSAVIDFGVPRTVSAVRAPENLQIFSVSTWIGAGFAEDSIYGALVKSMASGPQKGQTVVDAQLPSTARTAIFKSEVRTERLLVEIVGTTDASELSAEMAVVLPESPAGLELRIDNAQPVFTDAGPIESGSSATLTDSDYNSAGERIVHLAEALAALTGDPTSSESVTFKAVLTSRVPGVLGIRLLPGGQNVHYIRRVLFGSEPTKDLAFESEGQTDLPLSSLPPNLTIEEVRFTASGTFPPERVLPPVGPDPAGLAELVADFNRAALVRLRKQTGLVELTGVRLPLKAGSGGAEAAVALWSNKDAAVTEPLEAIAQAVTAPVTIDQATGDEAEWITFEFRQAVPIEALNPPWAALVLTRGELRCELGAVAAGGPVDPLGENVVRRGPPPGPWRPLPVPFLGGSTGLASGRGRIRMIGHAAKEAPLAPVKVELPGNTFSSGVTPTAKGVTASFKPPVPVSQTAPALRITNFIAGTLSIRDVDVVSTT